MVEGSVAAHSATKYTSRVPWKNLEPDCLVISCSDHRFEQQNREFLKHLGYERPHVLQIPSGPTLTLPMVASFGFLSKAIDKIIEKIVELKKVRTIVCIGHQDCGAYKAGHIELVNIATRRFTGESVSELQREHLAKAARRIKHAVPGGKVQAFFAAVKGEGENARVVFEEIPVG